MHEYNFTFVDGNEEEIQVKAFRLLPKDVIEQGKEWKVFVLNKYKSVEVCITVYSQVLQALLFLSVDREFWNDSYLIPFKEEIEREFLLTEVISL